MSALAALSREFLVYVCLGDRERERCIRCLDPIADQARVRVAAARCAAGEVPPLEHADPCPPARVMYDAPGGERAARTPDGL